MELPKVPSSDIKMNYGLSKRQYLGYSIAYNSKHNLHKWISIFKDCNVCFTPGGHLQDTVIN